MFAKLGGNRTAVQLLFQIGPWVFSASYKRCHRFKVIMGMKKQRLAVPKRKRRKSKASLTAATHISRPVDEVGLALITAAKAQGWVCGYCPSCIILSSLQRPRNWASLGGDKVCCYNRQRMHGQLGSIKILISYPCRRALRDTRSGTKLATSPTSQALCLHPFEC
jgi:hypothetical protein